MATAAIEKSRRDENASSAQHQHKTDRGRSADEVESELRKRYLLSGPVSCGTHDTLAA
jgi:hypothetical protein